MDVFLTPDWFIKHAVVGISIGYLLRVFEHFVWAKGQRDQNTLRWAVMVFPLCLVMGMALGYVSLTLFAILVKNEVAIQFAAYLFTGLMTFLALDFREFLRRGR
jgi:hypothetical protein